MRGLPVHGTAGKGTVLLAPKSSHFQGGYVGDAGGVMNEVFNVARCSAFSIVFIDEGEVVMPKRDKADNATSAGCACGEHHLRCGRSARAGA